MNRGKKIKVARAPGGRRKVAIAPPKEQLLVFPTSAHAAGRPRMGVEQELPPDLN